MTQSMVISEMKLAFPENVAQSRNALSVYLEYACPSEFIGNLTGREIRGAFKWSCILEFSKVTRESRGGTWG